MMRTKFLAVLAAALSFVRITVGVVIGITGIVITVRGTVPGLTAEQFAEFAEGAKTNCPVSKALTGTTITLDAALA